MAYSTTNPQDFLNSLKRDEVKVFLEAMHLRGGFSDLVNPRHVIASLNMDQIKTMKSIRPRNGAFLFEWMQCKVKEHHLDQPPTRHNTVSLCLNGTLWPESIQQRYNEFAVLKSIDRLSIFSHHIVLRYILAEEHDLALGINKNSSQGSHLCDTTGCVSEEHLCIEKQEVNLDRKHCQGITLHIYENTTNEFIIMQIDPCRHGEQRKEENGEMLKYSCRRIRVVLLKEEDLC